MDSLCFKRKRKCIFQTRMFHCDFPTFFCFTLSRRTANNVWSTCVLEFLINLFHYIPWGCRLLCDNYYFCYCWQGLFRNKTVYLPGFMSRAIFQINSSGEYVLFAEIILAQFSSAMPVSYSRLALVSNTDMKHSVEQRPKSVTVSMARVLPVA